MGLNGTALFAAMADNFAFAVQNGIEGSVAAEGLRDLLVAELGYTPVAAMNVVRVVVDSVVTGLGNESVYSEQDLRLIVARATGEA